MEITFNTRETYKAWRQEWKITYFQLSASIRSAKIALKEAHRNNAPAYMLHGNLRKLKAQANEMLETLQLAKQEAQKQYLASKVGEYA